MTTAPGERAPSFDPVAAMASRIEDGDQLGALTLAQELHPAQLAEAFAGVDREVTDLLVQRLTPGELGASLTYLEPHYREDLLVGLEPDRIASVLEHVADDVATDIVQELPEGIGSEVMAAIPLRQQHAIGALMEHDEESAGGRMTGQLIAILPDRLAGEAIEDLRSIQPDATQPFYVYIRDNEGRLGGVVNLRSLVLAASDTPVAELAVTDVVSVSASTDQEEAARLLKRYKLLSLPVVDDDGHLLGALTADDLIDVLEDEATEDMFRQVGVHEDEDLRSVRRSIRFRLPWLMVNLLTVLLAAVVVAAFEDTVAQVAVLAAFLPVVAGQGGNTGIQTLTVVVRSLAVGRLAGRNLWRVVLHEATTGLVNGVVIGAAVGVAAWLWQGNTTLGLVVGIALAVNMLVGVIAGVLIPMGLQRFRQDPALSAGIWLTTATDVLGFLVFLSLATLLVDAIG
ncbi:MAG: magnesium transporter [Chloroflexota bacterium]|nr:magnesium transporter [Chloroflexota bacterium]